MPNSSETFTTVPQPLPQRSSLKGRYIVGPVVGKPTSYIINYIGLDNQTNQKVVIRELFPSQFCVRGKDGKTLETKSTGDQVSAQTIKDKFTSQAKQYPIVPHPAIHSGVDVFKENGTCYQVLDYVKGIDFPTFVAQKGGRLNEEEAVQLFLPLLEGLKQIHDFGYHHGTVNPDQIRVVPAQDGNRLVLMNLGIPPKAGAKVLHGYTPPEVTSGKAPADKMTDIYGIAATLYFAVTGKTPPAATERLHNAELPLLANPDLMLSDALQAGILAGMATNSRERINTVLSLKLTILGEMNMQEEPPVKRSEPRPRRNPQDPLLPEEVIKEADEHLFDGIEAEPAARVPVQVKSSKNTKLLIGLIAGTFLIFFVPLWFFVISPILMFTNSTQEAMEEWAQQMEAMEQQGQQPDAQFDMEVPEENGSAQMTQRDAEVQKMLADAEALIAQESFSEAIALLQTTASKAPNNPKVHLALGRAFVKVNKMREAIQAFEKVLRLDPGNGEAYGSLGFIYYDSQRLERAQFHFKKAVALGDQVTIAFLQAEASNGNPTAQTVLRESGVSW